MATGLSSDKCSFVKITAYSQNLGISLLLIEWTVQNRDLMPQNCSRSLDPWYIKMLPQLKYSFDFLLSSSKSLPFLHSKYFNNPRSFQSQLKKEASPKLAIYLDKLFFTQLIFLCTPFYVYNSSCKDLLTTRSYSTPEVLIGNTPLSYSRY